MQQSIYIQADAGAWPNRSQSTGSGRQTLLVRAVSRGRIRCQELRVEPQLFGPGARRPGGRVTGRCAAYL